VDEGEEKASGGWKSRNVKSLENTLKILAKGTSYNLYGREREGAYAL